MTNIEPKFRDARLLEALDYLDPEYIDEVLDIIKIPSQKTVPQEGRHTTILSIKLFVALAAAILVITSAVPLLSYIIKNYLIFPGSTVTSENESEYYTETDADSEYIVRGFFKYLIDSETQTATLIGVEGDLPQNIEIPSYVDAYRITKIGDKVFYNRRNLVNVVIPDTVTEIGKEAFYGCQVLKSVAIPEGVVSIRDGAFEKCSFLNEIVLPESVNYIGNGAFKECQNLYSITLPSRVEHFDAWVFYLCNSLKSVRLSEGVKSLSFTFSGCESLTEVYLPDGITEIGEHAFAHCSSLESISLPASVRSIGYASFTHCPKLTEFSFAGSSEDWDSISRDGYWRFGSGFDKVKCSDGYVCAILSSRLYAVITNKEKFTMDSSGVQLYLKDSTYPSNISDGNTDPWSYTDFDTDDDGKNELFVTNGADVLILHDNGSEVRGYVLGTATLYYGGVLSHSHYDLVAPWNYTGIGRPVFSEDEFRYEDHCHMVEYKNGNRLYFVSNSEVSADEYWACVESYSSLSPDWHTLDYYIIKE